MWAKERHSRCLPLLKLTAGLGHLGILSCMKMWGKKLVLLGSFQFDGHKGIPKSRAAQSFGQS